MPTNHIYRFLWKDSAQCGGFPSTGKEKVFFESFLKLPHSSVKNQCFGPSFKLSQETRGELYSLFICWHGLKFFWLRTSRSKCKQCVLRNPKENLALLYRNTLLLSHLWGLSRSQTLTVRENNIPHSITNTTVVVHLTGTLSR